MVVAAELVSLLHKGKKYLLTVRVSYGGEEEDSREVDPKGLNSFSLVGKLLDTEMWTSPYPHNCGLGLPPGLNVAHGRVRGTQDVGSWQWGCDEGPPKSTEWEEEAVFCLYYLVRST